MSDPGARFSAADLEPSDEERRALRRDRVDRAAAVVTALSAGIWVGGMIALGACAAPFVFQMTPAPHSGNAMGAAFARFDHIAIGASVAILGCEVVRTWMARRRRQTVVVRLRRGVAILLAMCAAYVGLSLTPTINELHRRGVTRNVGPEGTRLEEIHRRAELVGKAEVALGSALVALAIFTIRRSEEDEDEDAPAPLPPGPSDG
jgi:uncharacterized membrane protein